MSTAVLILTALACLLLAAALWLWRRSQRQAQEQAIQGHLQRSLDIQQTTMAETTLAGFAQVANAYAPAPQPPLWQRWSQHLYIHTWGITQRTLGLLAIAGVVLAVFVGLQTDAVLGLLALLVYAVLCSFGIWRRKSKRREKMLQQLPGFLDNMVRLISIGNSPQAAFQLSVANVPAPLSEAMQQATASLSASPDLGNAMSMLERHWQLPEFGLLAAVFRMSTRYGGRADLVLERVATYIRDQQSAERELHALSAEVRLSAWVLALLPIVVGGLIIVLNPGYFTRMWNDDSGQKMVLIAAGLEAFGSFLLYRLARLR